MRLPSTSPVLPALLLVLVAAPAQAQVTWASDSSGNWSVASNWSTNQIPQAGEHVVIDRPGSVTVTVNVATAAIASLTAAENVVVNATLTVDGDAFFDGGLTLNSDLAGTGTFTLRSTGTWNGGTITAPFVVGAGHTLSIATTNPHILSSVTLTNQGTVVANGSGGILLSGIAGIVNASGALWDVQSTGAINTSGGVATQSVSNAGTFRKSVNTSPMSVVGSVAFSNTGTGTIDVQTGTLSLGGGGAVISGTATVAAGATLTLPAAATLNTGATLSGDGTLNITGTTTVAGAVSVGVPTTFSGTLNGIGPITMNASMNWMAGTIGTALVNGAGRTLSITTPNPHVLSSATLTNHGTVVANGSGGILLSGIASIVNAGGGLWDAQSTGAINTTGGVAAQSVSNAGTFRKSVSLSPLSVVGSVAFSNTGTIDVQTGTLSLGGGGATIGGTATVAAGATLTLAAASTLNAGATLTGAGTLNITAATTVAGAVSSALPVTLSGTLTGTGPLTMSAAMNWIAGTIGTAVVNSAGQTLSITTTNPHTLLSATLTNQGTVAWSGTGGVLFSGNASISNAIGATFDVQAGTAAIQTGTAGTQTFTNAGTLRKTVATGTLSIVGSVQFTNTGAIELRLGGTTAGQFDVLALSQPFTVGGTLDISTAGGFEPRFFHAFNVVTYPSRTNTFTSIDGNGETYIDQYQTTALRLRPLADPLENLIRNGTLDTDLTNWLTFATPNSTYLSTAISGGVLNFYRVPPPAGTSNQATVYQETQAYLPAGTTLSASFNLANTSSVRKRISVLMLDSDFSDLAVCTLFLEPGAPMRTYMMRTQAGKIWENAALYFYAASPGDNGGAYQLDTVSMHYDTTLPGDRTTCHDATAPTAPGGAADPNLLVNGDFSSAINTGADPRWNTFGQIQSQVAGGVFEFIKLAGAPAGVVLQRTGQVMTTDQILTSTFQLGNSSGVRKRVTVIIHDNDFSDLSACTFWLDPGQPLSTYAYRTFTTKAWTNATLSVYPATVGAAQWIRLDNVTFQRTPGTAIVGTECIEPGGGGDQRMAGRSSDGREGDTLPGVMVAGGSAGATATNGARSPALEAWFSHWVVDGFLPVGDWLDGPTWTTTASDTRVRAVRPLERLDLTHAVSASVRFASTLHADAGSTALLQISHDGATWETAHVVAPSASAANIDVDLSVYRGTAVFVRFVLEGVAPDDGAAADTWRIEDVSLDVVVDVQVLLR